MHPYGWRLSALSLVLVLHGTGLIGAETFRVATYNLEGYLDEPSEKRPAKPLEAKAKIRESLLILRPDVLALQEMGSTRALLELRDALKADGLDLPHWEHVAGVDTNIHVAVLSRFPFAARLSRTNESFLLSGRRFRVSRGFGELKIRVNSRYTFTLITAHLKSKRPVVTADEAEQRLEEAKLLRQRVDAYLSTDPDANLIVLGDFNDSCDSASTKAVIGKGKLKLLDARPAERNGDEAIPRPNREYQPRNVTWTHHYGKDDTYSRIDFILLSPGMAREWISSQTYVLELPNWGIASDHRPLVATFEAEDRKNPD